MQNRRQTIWLVSMLSLMVILSAYYLLTEEVNPGKKSELSASTGQDDIRVTEIDPPQGEEAAGGMGDEEALESMNRAFFDQVELDRRTWFDREHERLSMIISDTANHTQEEAAAAVEELSRLEEMDERITSLQTKLLSSYDNAAVELEENRYKVIVQADALDRRQAVDIVDLAVRELGITPDQVAVQYVP